MLLDIIMLDIVDMLSCSHIDILIHVKCAFILWEACIKPWTSFIIMNLLCKAYDLHLSMSSNLELEI